MRARHAFTLVELLVVLAIVGVLGALVLPLMSRSKSAAAAARCASNIRQLHTANVLYAADRGSYAPAADDFFGANTRRWHGERLEGEAFDASKGPLVPYLGDDGRVRQCPAFRSPQTGFETGNGAYGYNAKGVGSRSYLMGFTEAAMSVGMSPGSIAKPAGTVMFADTAYPVRIGGRSTLMEYSFVESYFHITDRLPVETAGLADPSTHFRHNGRATVVWSDGHVTAEAATIAGRQESFRRNQIGWFGERNNDAFDPF